MSTPPTVTFEVRKEPAQTVAADDAFPIVAAFHDAVVQDLEMGWGREEERKRGREERGGRKD